MTDHDAIQRSWQQISETLRQHWAQLTNDELKSFDGDINDLVNLIQRKTGEARQIIERYLDELMAGAASKVKESADDVREYAIESREQLQEGAQQAAEVLRECYRKAEAYARKRPTETMLFCFGAGILAGVMLGFSTRRS